MATTEQFLFCADNLFCELIYPGHIIAADQERAGYEAWHVGDARRQPSDHWEPTTANADHWVKATFDQLRAFDFVAIDRESNHRGKRFQLQASSDDFSSATTPFDITLPSVPGGTLDGSVGAITDEGVWVNSFTPVAGHAARFYSFAMGAGIVPQISNLWVGKSWRPTDFMLNYPVEDHKYRIDYTETKSPRGWAGRSRVARARAGEVVIRPTNENDYDMIQWQVLGLYAAGYPAWIVHNRGDGARRAFLAYCPPGDIDWGLKTDWAWRGITIPFVEEQPA